MFGIWFKLKDQVFSLTAAEMAKCCVALTIFLEDPLQVKCSLKPESVTRGDLREDSEVV